jgi:hypothetical protein
VWIDAQDVEVARLEARIIDDYRVAGGLVASVKKGSDLIVEQERVNGEVWQPSLLDFSLDARFMLFKSVHERVLDRSRAITSFGWKRLSNRRSSSDGRPELHLCDTPPLTGLIRALKYIPCTGRDKGMSGPLAGLKVVEMVGLGPAPFCAMLLADMGAEVIPVEGVSALLRSISRLPVISPESNESVTAASNFPHPDFQGSHRR